MRSVFAPSLKTVKDKVHWLLFVGVGLLVFGCNGLAYGPGVSDFSAELSNDYFIHHTSAHQIVVAPISFNDETPIIPTRVIEVGYDQNFIVAKQQLLERLNPDTPNDGLLAPIPDAFQYWILDFQAEKFHGPLTLEDYRSKRTTLGVPETIQLSSVYDYRPATEP